MPLSIGLTGLSIGGQSGSGFSPANIPNLLAWWDASDASTITLQTGTTIGDATVTSIASKVGSEVLSTWQGVFSNGGYPAYLYGLNGRPAVSNVDTTTSALVSQTGSLFDSGRTFFHVNRVYEDAVTIFGGGVSSAGRTYLNGSGNYNYSDQQGGGDLTMQTGVNKAYGLIVTCLRFNSDSSLDVYVGSGDTPFNMNPSTAGLGNYYVPMGSYNGGAGTGKHDWHESLVYDAVLSDEDVEAVLGYLESKWADNNALYGISLEGQSNPRYGDINTATRFDREDRMKVYQLDDQLVDYDYQTDVATPAGSNYPVLNDGSVGYSAAPALMDYLARRMGGKFVAIPSYKGGQDLTSPNEWGKRTTDFDTSTLFGAANERIRLAEALGVSLIAVMWQQGESDAQDATLTEAEYDTALEALVADQREALNKPNLIYTIGVVPDALPVGTFPNRAEVKAAQLAFDAANTAVADTSGFSVQVDNIHFDNAGIDDAGELHAEKILGLL